MLVFAIVRILSSKNQILKILPFILHFMNGIFCNWSLLHTILYCNSASFIIIHTDHLSNCTVVVH